MNWFQQITGFSEVDYDATRQQLAVNDGRLHSSHTDRTFAVGELTIPSLNELRQQAQGLLLGRGRTTVRCVRGDVRRMHADARNAGAIFQVASQFNLLEMVGPSISPEHGVARYEFDLTQGPACAIAAGAGTIYRNYFVPVDGMPGQRVDRQIDCLRQLGDKLGNRGGRLWTMQNGYCIVTDDGLAAVDARLAGMDAEQLHALSGELRVGVHADVEVTEGSAGHLVSQIYCSALPVAYNRVRRRHQWERFASLVLEGAYEATLLAAAVRMASRGDCVPVFLTRLGGGAFGNEPAWIDKAMRRAMLLCRDAGLDVRLVSYGQPDPGLLELEAEFAM